MDSKSLRDIGGDFTMKKQYCNPSVLGKHTMISPYNTQDPAFRVTYSGPICPPVTLSFPPFANSSELELQRWGTKAISLCSPANSVANLATALGEIRNDGLPKVLGASSWENRIDSIRKGASSTGDEFLNIAFGWLPLISDITDLAKGAVNLDKLMEQYIKGAGETIRRSHHFPTVESKQVDVVKENCSPSISPDSLQLHDLSKINKGSYVRSRLTTIRRWFSGSFTYYLPREWRDSMSDRVALARHLLGLDLTPEVLWNLAPWSWAVDWFGGVGDIIHNAESIATDSLVLHYGYIMEHSVVQDTYSFVGPTGFLSSQSGRPADMVLTSEAKIRRASSPFGFGISTGLTTQQKSIVAALGMSRA